MRVQCIRVECDCLAQRSDGGRRLALPRARHTQIELCDLNRRLGRDHLLQQRNGCTKISILDSEDPCVQRVGDTDAILRVDAALLA